MYLDASVLIALLAEEPTSGAVRRFLRAHREDRLVSDFAAAEVASAISRLLRMRLLTEEEGSIRLADFDAWRAAATSAADVHAADARLAYIYVRRFDLGLRAPDALHLAIARRLDATLVTLDRRLAIAANQLGVAVEALRAS
ncbi:MAG: type II toxin-antitoxin system VapC family toxin [Alphaproteobacteria bacterium]|nr:type II toxin-antitoxin system VapC family toxin [Alphaproteobacteria bacterium]